MKNNRLRLPAEWEPQDAIILAWPHAHTDWAYMLDEVRQCFYNIIKAILNEGERVVVLHENIDDDRLAEIKRCGAILVETQRHLGSRHLPYHIARRRRESHILRLYV